MRDATPTEVRIAAPWMRLVAWGIDLLILVSLCVGIALVLFGEKPSQEDTFILVVIAAAIYNVTWLTLISSTPGKSALRMSVVDKDGLALRPDTAILRYIVLFIGGTVTIGTLASVVLIVTDPQRRAVHDRVAGTRVIVGRPRVVDRLNRYQ